MVSLGPIFERIGLSHSRTVKCPTSCRSSRQSRCALSETLVGTSQLDSRNSKSEFVQHPRPNCLEQKMTFQKDTCLCGPASIGHRLSTDRYLSETPTKESKLPHNFLRIYPALRDVILPQRWHCLAIAHTQGPCPRARSLRFYLRRLHERSRKLGRQNRFASQVS